MQDIITPFGDNSIQNVRSDNIYPNCTVRFSIERKTNSYWLIDKKDSIIVQLLTNILSCFIFFFLIGFISYNIGGSDPQYYKGELNYVNLTEETAWIFNMDKVSIDDLVVCRDCSAFADTGTGKNSFFFNYHT